MVTDIAWLYVDYGLSGSPRARSAVYEFLRQAQAGRSSVDQRELVRARYLSQCWNRAANGPGLRGGRSVRGEHPVARSRSAA
jgi:hypothetical protein